jgi:hypothetical protein
LRKCGNNTQSYYPYYTISEAALRQETTHRGPEVLNQEMLGNNIYTCMMHTPEAPDSLVILNVFSDGEQEWDNRAMTQLL